jgi:hypothetical protein
MPAMAEPKLIKVCLTNKGDDTETPWAHELGPAANAPAGSLKVKLVNVPFMHAKPTWGDTIVVSPANDTFPTWDRDGVPWKQINTKILEDGGRWAMIIDYKPTNASTDDAFAALGRACDAHKIVCEGAWAPRDQEPGRAYLAVQKELTADQVMSLLESAKLPVALTQIHPEPKKKPAPSRANTQVGISDEAGRPPAKPARAKTEKPLEAEAPAKPAKRAATQPPVKAQPPASTKSAKAVPAAAKSSKAPAKPAAKPASNAKITPAKPAARAPAKPAAKALAKPAAKSAPAKKLPKKK